LVVAARADDEDKTAYMIPMEDLANFSGDVSRLAPESDVVPSSEVEQSARQYAFPLSLNGLELNPRKPVRADDSTGPASVGNGESVPPLR